MSLDLYKNSPPYLKNSTPSLVLILRCLSLFQEGTTAKFLTLNIGHNHPYLVCELTHIMANASPVDNSVSISVEQHSRLGFIYCTILIITAETAIATAKATKLNQQQDHD